MLRNLNIVWVLGVVIGLMVFVHSLFGVMPVVAQSTLADAPKRLEQSADGTGIGEGTQQGDLATVIASALRLGLSLLGTLMLGYMVYAGYLWMTAQGDEGAIGTAKGIMINTVIGFLVVVSAWAITYLVQSRFR